MTQALLSLVLAAAPLLAAQTSGELRGRFGHPRSEEFAATKDIAVKVAYDTDNAPCEFVITAQHPVGWRPDAVDQDVVLPLEDVTKLTDELSPPAQRGPKTNWRIEQMGCAIEVVTEYEHVTISQTAMCQQSRVTGVYISYTQKHCR